MNVKQSGFGTVRAAATENQRVFLAYERERLVEIQKTLSRPEPGEILTACIVLVLSLCLVYIRPIESALPVFHMMFEELPRKDWAAIGIGVSSVQFFVMFYKHWIPRLLLQACATFFLLMYGLYKVGGMLTTRYTAASDSGMPILLLSLVAFATLLKLWSNYKKEGNQRGSSKGD